MNTILDIIIPHYHEDEKTVAKLLDSIAFQDNIDFSSINVVIVNDGSDVLLSDEFLTKYPFNIEYYLNEKSGVSVARQTGYEVSHSPYVMFCDADDCFYCVSALYNIMNTIKGGFDILISAFVEESKFENQEPVYLVRELDACFVHGKVYRREYLDENEIVWRSELTCHEDVYFNSLAARLAKDIKYISSPTYLWRNNKQSVSRQKEFILTTYTIATLGNELLVREFLKHDREDLAKYAFANFVFDAYNTMHKLDWDSYPEYRDKTIAALRYHFSIFADLWDAGNEKCAADNMITDASAVDEWFAEMVLY